MLSYRTNLVQNGKNVVHLGTVSKASTVRRVEERGGGEGCLDSLQADSGEKHA